MANPVVERSTSNLTISSASLMVSVTLPSPRMVNASEEFTAPSGTHPERKLPYPADQQAEFLYLQAETEALLQQLQSLKQQRAVAIH